MQSMHVLTFVAGVAVGFFVIPLVLKAVSK